MSEGTSTAARAEDGASIGGAAPAPRVNLLVSWLVLVATAIYSRPALKRFVIKVQFWFARVPGLRQLLLFFYARMLPLDRHPQRIAAHINSACNLSCAYCYSDKTRAALPIERWLAVIDEGIRDLKVNFVQILGGEPLLHPRFLWFIEQLARRRLMIAINTNGVLLDADMLERLRPYRWRLAFFVNFEHPEHFQGVRDDAALYETIRANIERCKRAGFATAVFLTITRDNVTRIPEIVDQVDRQGIGVVAERCLPVRPEVEPLGVTREQWQELLRVLEDGDHLVSPNRLFAVRKGRACMDYGRIIYLTQEGDALPCAFAPPELSLGNVERDSLTAIWRRVGEAEETWHQVPKECGGCSHVEYCGGGCKTHVWLAYKRFDRRDPLCDGNGRPPTVVGL